MTERKPKSLVLNLSKQKLTETDSPVLKLGLTFSLAQRNYNKEKFTTDFYKFIRRLKLRESIFEQGKEDFDDESNIETLIQDEDMIWNQSNPHWYPPKSTSKAIERLEKFHKRYNA